MKTSTTKNPDTFQDSFKTFKMLIAGSKMAKVSTLLLIGFSLLLMFYADKNMLSIGSLLIGIVALMVYLSKYLSLKTIEQKSYTQTSLISSISKFRTYMTNRKKYEIYYTLIWTLSLFPFMASYFGSEFKAIIATVLFITITGVFGMLGFIKSERELKKLEIVMNNDLKLFKSTSY